MRREQQEDGICVWQQRPVAHLRNKREVAGSVNTEPTVDGLKAKKEWGEKESIREMIDSVLLQRGELWCHLLR